MILLFFLILFWIALGITQGILWSKKGAEAFRWNEHIVFVSTVVVALVCMFISYQMSDGRLLVLSILSAMFMYPFFYNGSYYESRKRIAQLDNRVIYPQGWRSDPSVSSTALINFRFKQRLALLYIGVIIIGGFYIYKYTLFP